MKNIHLQITDSLDTALRHVADDKLGPTVERLLWDHPEIQQAAETEGVEREERPSAGRPRKEST